MPLSVAKPKHFLTHFNAPLLPLCLVIAALCHGLLLLLSFVAPTGDRALMQDIELNVQLSGQKRTDNADFASTVEQQGSGQSKQPQRKRSPESVQMPQTEQTPSAPPQLILKPARLHQPAQVPHISPDERVLVTQLSWKKKEKTVRQKPQKPEPTSQPNAPASPQPVQVLQASIERLEADRAQSQQDFNKLTRIKTIDSATTRADPAANYLDYFRKRVESAGNKHYPALARTKNMEGDVRLMVILQSDGMIRAIRLLQGSGHNLLDNAAKQSVRDAAPYKKFDKDLKNFDELRIIRTWRFSAKEDELSINP